MLPQLESVILSEALKWPKRLAYIMVAIGVSMVIIFIILYYKTGNKTLLAAAAFVAVITPIDYIIIRVAATSNAKKLADRAVRILDRLKPTGPVRAVGLPTGLLVAAQVENGQVHVFLTSDRVEIVHVASPISMPLKSKPLMPRLSRRTRILRLKCKHSYDEGVWEITSMDPARGDWSRIRGNIRLAYITCRAPVSDDDLEKLLSMVPEI
ncbi:MAG: hypothetical protein GSR85_01800 [Desulfurococcales archaeon]|nr:hypothetical protein [Desulfurococcales archaeon]